MRAAIQSQQGQVASRKAVLVIEEPIAELSAATVHSTTQPVVVWAPFRAAKDLRDTPDPGRASLVHRQPAPREPWLAAHSSLPVS